MLKQAALHGAAAVCIVLAAVGLQVPAHAPRQVVAVAADTSDSIFDLATQTGRLTESLAALDPDTTQAAAAVFGRNTGLERAMAPLAPHPTTAAHSSALRGAAPFVDLSRPATVVDRSATDVGAAVNFARGLFAPDTAGAARGILLLSDFRDTCGSADAAAAALRGSGIDLLACPALLGPASDVHLAALRVPERSQLGRDVPVEMTVASQSPCTVRVAVWRTGAGGDETPVDFKTVTLTPEPGARSTEIRRLVRVLDHNTVPGVAVYTARVTGPDGELPGDISLNNQLSAATRIVGPSKWAAIARPDSTLAVLCADKTKPLGVEMEVFASSTLPHNAAAYEPFAGILVDGLSAAELPEGPALRAIADAVANGKALLALGGERAFGAGGHREGAWERLLPVEMTPEDDRTRSVLFVMDVSKSMEQRMGRDGSGVRKIDFAAEQLALAVQKLKPLDRLGLVSFSATAQLAAALSTESSRATFLNAVRGLAIQSNTDMVPALNKALETLAADDAEEQLVVILSDGVQTITRPQEEIIQAAKDLCPPARDPAKPPRTTLFTFGIGVDAKDTDPAGEKLLQALAEAGGGSYSPEFLKLAERLEQAFAGAKKDFYVRREPFVPRPGYEHPLVAAFAQRSAALPFRNRVKAKPTADVLLWTAPAATLDQKRESRRPDPILTLSGSAWEGMSRRAALAVSLDGDAGTAYFANQSCRALLPALLEWLEAKRGADVPGWTVTADAENDDSVAVEVLARDPNTHLPVNGRMLFAELTPVTPPSLAATPAPRPALPAAIQLHPSAPGTYRALLPKPPQGVYRLTVQEEVPSSSRPETRDPRPRSSICERFVTVPYPAELRRFGTDRAAMQQLVAKAGGDSRIIENPQDIARWAADKASARETYSLRPWLIGLGMLFLLVEYFLRGRR
jgi:Mg-chelatase subunit ChlD